MGSQVKGIEKGKFTHYADGGVGEVFESTKHFWSLGGGQCCSQICTSYISY